VIPRTRRTAPAPAPREAPAARPRPGARMESHQSLIQRMRETASARVEYTSLRSVAREIGMSPSGLGKFLDGAAPYTPTLRRLRQWYLQYGAVSLGRVEAEDASSALSVLLHDLSPDARREVAGTILERLRRAYEASGKPVPPWLPDMLAASSPAAEAGDEEED
jgi:hypothetical protein